MSSILVFGASGAVGHWLLPQLTAAHRVTGVSRATTDQPGWLRADINDADIAWPAAEVVISLGPLDAFAAWLERRHDPALRRIVALSSMSAETKRDSAEAAERELAARLGAAEQSLLRVGTERGISVTLFRPTLIYGAGTDASLAPIARAARRFRVLPVPVGAKGLRQPVHARDLAGACRAVLDNAATYGRTYPLGGGERLSFAAMIGRLRACVAGPVLRLPVPIFALRLARAAMRGAPGDAAIARLREPLIADNSAAARDFGYAPGPFDPRAVLPPPE